MKSKKLDSKSISGSDCGRSAPIDRLSDLLERCHVRAELFHHGFLCDRTRFEAVPGRAFLHVLRNGALTVRHRRTSGLPPALMLKEPSLLLYARPVFHEFVHRPQARSEFTCAALEFDGGPHHPLVQALPTFICLPLAELDALRPALELLFAELERQRCGSRVLADRLFEVVLIQLLRWMLDHPECGSIAGGMLAGLADARLARALVAMHRDPARDWSLTALAAEAAMSRSAFAAAFKHVVGTTPVRYLCDWRLTLASAQLRCGQPLKRVASDVGLSAGSSLSRAFKKRFGTSPRAWLGARREERGDAGTLRTPVSPAPTLRRASVAGAIGAAGS